MTNTNRMNTRYKPDPSLTLRLLLRRLVGIILKLWRILLIDTALAAQAPHQQVFYSPSKALCLSWSKDARNWGRKQDKSRQRSPLAYLFSLSKHFLQALYFGAQRLKAITVIFQQRKHNYLKGDPNGSFSQTACRSWRSLPAVCFCTAWRAYVWKARVRMCGGDAHWPWMWAAGHTTRSAAPLPITRGIRFRLWTYGLVHMITWIIAAVELLVQTPVVLETDSTGNGKRARDQPLASASELYFILHKRQVEGHR